LFRSPDNFWRKLELHIPLWLDMVLVDLHICKKKKSFVKIKNSSQHFSYPHLCDGNGNDADSSRLSATS
jgi:hypothetical protein